MTKPTKKIPQSHACSLLYPPLIYVRRTSVTSPNDITVICFCIWVGKTFAHVQSSWVGSPVHPPASLTYFPYPTMHQPLCIFCTPISAPVTYIISLLTNQLRRTSRKVTIKYVAPLGIHKIVDPHNYLLMTLDGKILRGLFEHERLKPVIIRTSQGNVNSLV